MEWERRKFLIVVKTYPNPSASLQEVVCTAAIRDDGKLVRLFPIPFRTLAESTKFAKWQWIEANVIKAKNDPRSESFKVDVPSITTLETIPAGKGWPTRWALVEPLISTSLESLKMTGASLGPIKPATFDLTFKDKDVSAWTDDEREKLIGARGAVDLFGKASRPNDLLEKLPVEIRYKYTCDDASCTGHEQLFEDWEVGQSWRAWRQKYRDRAELEQKLRERYAVIPLQKGNLYLWVGTHSVYDVWLVIGQAQPAHLVRST